jgi:DnaK suppressor protein
MRQDQLKSLHQLLLRQRESLLNKNRSFALETREGSTVAGDEADLAMSETNRNLSIRLIERERVLVSKIDRALEKISVGNYGNCEECGESLGYNRLKARPVASLCIDCKLAQEKEEQVYA